MVGPMRDLAFGVIDSVSGVTGPVRPSSTDYSIIANHVKSLYRGIRKC